MAKPGKAAQREGASSVRISKTLKKRLKVYAAGEDKDMRELVDLAVEDYLKKRGS